MCKLRNHEVLKSTGCLAGRNW